MEFAVEINSKEEKVETPSMNNSEDHKSNEPPELLEENLLSCTVCPQSFQSILEFRKHIRSHTGELMYDCHLCLQTFTTLKDFNFHLKHHGNEPRCPFKCEICPAKFKDSARLKTHVMIHTGEKPFGCGTCGSHFRQKSALDRHLWIHQDFRPLIHPCKFCTTAFPTTAQRNRHEAMNHTGEKNHHCPTCQKSFYDSGHLKKHIRTHTGERNHPCTLCPSRFKEKHQLDTHIRTHTGERPFCCSICGKSFGTNVNCQKHIRTMHVKPEDGKMAKKKSEPAKCTVCSKILQSELSLERHMKKHTGGEGTFKCEICNIVIVKKNSFEKHMKEGLHRSRNTAGIRRFKCEYCPSSFKEKRVLERHMRLHTGERPFSCSTCGRKFNCQWVVNRHMATRHNKKNEKPKKRKCHICSKTFPDYSKLKAHMEKHDTDTGTGDVKGYRCGLCGIFMKTWNSFERHMEQHEKYCCKICNLDFPVESEFEAHLETHWDMKPTCDICGDISDSHKDLSVHFIQIHNLPRVYLKKLKDTKILKC